MQRRVRHIKPSDQVTQLRTRGLSKREREKLDAFAKLEGTTLDNLLAEAARNLIIDLEDKYNCCPECGHPKAS